jgi:hypothetical protein
MSEPHHPDGTRAEPDLERPQATADAHAPTDAQEHDRDINYKGILWVVGGLLIAAVVIHLGIWYLLRSFEGREEARQAPLTPIRQATPQGDPPGPRLQTAPEEDMRALRAEEEALLGRAAWVDRQAGTVRVPIEIAIEMIAREGAGQAGEAAAPADGQPEEEGREMK